MNNISDINKWLDPVSVDGDAFYENRECVKCDQGHPMAVMYAASLVDLEYSCLICDRYRKVTLT